MIEYLILLTTMIGRSSLDRVTDMITGDPLVVAGALTGLVFLGYLVRPTL
jgi:hypothetical protein